MNSNLELKILQNLQIALVDDSRSFGAGLSSMLAQLDIKLNVHHDPVTALQTFNLNPVDLIICDYEMPSMSGLEFISKFRENLKNSETPILVLTSSEDAETMKSVISQGADAFAIKSNVKTTLVAQLFALARLREMYKNQSKIQQMDAIKALIGTYKHEFGNALMIAQGKLSKLERLHESIRNDPSLLAIKQAHDRFQETLQKLNKLRTYEEENYVNGTKILKAG